MLWYILVAEICHILLTSFIAHSKSEKLTFNRGWIPEIPTCNPLPKVLVGIPHSTSELNFKSALWLKQGTLNYIQKFFLVGLFKSRSYVIASVTWPTRWKQIWLPRVVKVMLLMQFLPRSQDNMIHSDTEKFRSTDLHLRMISALVSRKKEGGFT